MARMAMPLDRAPIRPPTVKLKTWLTESFIVRTSSAVLRRDTVVKGETRKCSSSREDTLTRSRKLKPVIHQAKARDPRSLRMKSDDDNDGEDDGQGAAVGVAEQVRDEADRTRRHGRTRREVDERQDEGHGKGVEHGNDDLPDGGQGQLLLGAPFEDVVELGEHVTHGRAPPSSGSRTRSPDRCE